MLMISLESIFRQLIFVFVISQVGLNFAAKLFEAKILKEKKQTNAKKKNL